MKKAYYLIVYGRVQGVGYRLHTSQQASKHGITGWVRNLPNGTVEVYCQGEEEDLITFLESCEAGPSYAQVEHIEKANVKIDRDIRDFKVIP